MKQTRYIVVTGGVLSGLGKGITTVSIGKLLQARGYTVEPIKIDPYVNIDAGTMNPIEHGEVFVLADGAEVDMDLGSYERFLDVNLKRDNNITTGKIYLDVIQRERKGEYLGRTVQPIPHVTGRIKEWIRDLGKDKDFVIVEIGGTVGDIENLVFLEACRELSREEPVFFVHVSYVPILDVVGEQKTKPTQHSVKELRGVGIQPHMIVCRCKEPLEDRIKQKIALFCGVPEERVISDHDVETIYEVPLLLKEQRVDDQILEHFGIRDSKPKLGEWKEFVNRVKNPKKTVKIALAGKYTKLHDSYVSIEEALVHAGAAHECRVVVEQIETTDIEEGKTSPEELLKDKDGLIVPGGFGSRGVEGKIECIKWAREHKLPFLGLCYGFQLACVEFARNVCGLDGAHTTEVNKKTRHPVIYLLPSQRGVKAKGATMRLGEQPAILKKDSLVARLYGKTRISERHRHRYEFNIKYKELMEKKGLLFSGESPDGTLMEFLELPDHPFFVATQGHPEFKSRPLKPHPLFYGLVGAAIERAGKHK